MKKISICIPTFEMHGKGVKFLRNNFDIFISQTFKDFEVIISDHSKNDEIYILCSEYASMLDIKYFRNINNIGNSSANLNNAMSKASGELIKILFQDDFLFKENALFEIVTNFDLSVDSWMVTPSISSEDAINFYNPFYPKYHDKIYLGKNTISSPSVLTIKNDKHLIFDEKLIWLMDVDFYKRYYDKYGLPKVLNTINVVNRIGDHQISNKLKVQRKEAEERYMRTKFISDVKKKKPFLPNVTLVAVSSVKIKQTIKALSLSSLGIDFYDVVMISHVKPKRMSSKISFKQCEQLKSINDYSSFMLYELCKYIETDYVLVVQYDGYILRPNMWQDSFLNYDYIGAPWSKNLHFTKKGTNIRVGNGGFSLRSKKLLNSFNSLNLSFNDFGTGYFNEDGAICNYYRSELESFGVNIAPVEVASKFSCETICDDSCSIPFGFHKNYKLIPFVVYLKKLFV